ncbi:hypothetical protein ACHQM5_026654 [Ranunculus cassubicifolius]
MAEKRKSRGGGTISRGGEKKRKSIGSKKNPKKNREERKGPRIPNSLRREVDSVNPRNRGSDDDSDNDDEIDLQDIDVYEYDEAKAEEESKKNKRYDAVENYQYELPEEFEDENVSSDDDDDNVGHASGSKSSYSSDESGDDEDEYNDGRHAKMLQDITGMPAEAFEGKKKTFDVVSEAYPESEYNPTQSSLDGDGPITVDDLLNPLQKKRGYGDLRKRIHKLESLSVQTPISQLMRENVERKVAYEVSKEEITKWEPLVKRNREASTIFFDADTNVGFSTVGAIASDFKPRTAFEKKMDSLVHDPKIVEAHKEDGARLLELNKISIEDVKERQNRLAKMRSLLFRHETKAKHIKKIKSKTYHRLLKKNKLKAANAEIQTDPEAAKEEAIKQEFKRAEERLRLKHKNKNKWAERVLKLGLAARDEGTRVALIEQLNEHAVLTRKIGTMKESSSSSDEDSDEDNEDDFELSPSREQDASSKLLNKAKEKTIKVMEADNEMPSSGVLSLPFMVRGMKKREEEALKEAEHAVKEYELSLKKLDDSSEGESPKAGILSGRRVFGAAKKQSQDSGSMIKTNRRDRDRDTDSEDDYEAKDHADPERPKDLVHVNANMVYEGSDTDLQSIDDIIRDSVPRTTHEVAMFAPNSNKKTGNKNVTNDKAVGSRVVVEEPTLPEQDVKEVNSDEDTESEEEMEGYKLPSQEELMRRAFAGDDVEEEFEKDKQEVLNEENPEPEKPVLVPGWGQWTHVQKKKGMPSWMLAEHEVAKKKREDSIKQRKDAHLKHVVISEKVNKKADKLHATTLPFPFTSKEAYEQSIRVPIGPEYNPATVVGDLIRPEVVKKAGLIIKPIKFEDVDPHERGDGEQKSKGQSQKGSNKNRSGKGIKSKKIK